MTLVAMKRPGWFCIITRPSPELFGLIDATSNAGAGAAGPAAPAPPSAAPHGERRDERRGLERLYILYKWARS